MVSPFVKEQVISQILGHKCADAKVHLISSFNIGHFYEHTSDVSAFREVIDTGGIVSNYQRLHSKIYIFDDRYAVITSSNLTMSGLTANYEYGVLISNRETVEEISEDFDELSQHEDAGTIDIEALDQIETILQQVPPRERIKLPQLHIQRKGERIEDESDLLFEENQDAIRISLTGWKLDTFDILTTLRTQTFRLDDVYDFVPRLEKKYPDNKNIRPKIRQQLQFLRDLGLIKFLGGARYKKLWN